MLPFVTISCPSCGEPQALAVDHSAGDQQYVEDCQVCCRPMWLQVRVDDAGEVEVSVRAQDEI